MITDADIKRINELYHKSKSEGLTPDEKQEQVKLTEAYIESVRASTRRQLNNIDVKKTGWKYCILEGAGSTVIWLRRKNMPTDICEAKRMLRKEILSKRRHLGEEICRGQIRQTVRRSQSSVWMNIQLFAARYDFMLCFLQRGGGHLEADRKSFGGRQKSSIA